MSLKGLFSLGFIVLMGLVLIFSACTKKTIVNPAPTPETASCFTCHSDSNTFIAAPKGQWEKSVHSTGEHIYENSSGCSFCHTNEGFISLILTGTTIEVENPSAIGCFTCHAPHTTGNLTLRTNASYMLLDSTSSSTYDKGPSNLCANCHHARRNVNTYVYDGVKMSSHYGPHHSPQADMLLGTNAYEYSGVSYDTISYHSYGVTEGCITCHMETSVGYTLGGHSMNMVWEEEENVESCNSTVCHHGTITDFNRLADEDYDNDGNKEGVRDEIEGLLNELKTKLIAANLLTSGGSPVSRVVATADSVGAVYNYEFVEADRSGGIHNTKYAVKLLQSSIDFLESGGGGVSAWK